MTKTFQQAAAEAQTLLRGFQGLQAVAETLDGAAQLEQQIAELTKSRDGLQGERDKLLEELTAGRNNLLGMQAEGQELVAKANEDAAEIKVKAIREGADEANGLLSKARAAAMDAKRAEEQALKNQAEAEAAVEALRSETADLEKRAAAARTYLDTLTKA